jgi:hypothetical protein
MMIDRRGRGAPSVVHFVGTGRDMRLPPRTILLITILSDLLNSYAADIDFDCTLPDDNNIA